MKPFNLEEALVGKPVKLRDGRKAYVRYHETEFPVEEDMRLIGFLPDGSMMSWRVDGYYDSQEYPAGGDIVGMYPETRIINGFEVPAPEKDAPGIGSLYFTPDNNLAAFFDATRWDDDFYDNRVLERGLVFLNAEDAIANAKAMLGINPNTGDE